VDLMPNEHVQYTESKMLTPDKMAGRLSAPDTPNMDRMTLWLI